MVRRATLVFAALVVMTVYFSGMAVALDTLAGGAKVSATQTNTATALGNTVTSLTVYNAGANEIFIAINAAATASSIEVPAGATVTFTDFTVQTVGIICSTGETSTVYLYWTIQ